MAKQDLAGGLKNLLSHSAPDAQQEQETALSITEQLRATLTDTELLKALKNEEQLRQALRAKRFAGGRPKKGETNISQTRGYGRTCIVANVVKMDKIREIAFRETLTIKQIFEAMMDNLITTYEAKHGEVVPQDHSGDVNKLYN